MTNACASATALVSAQQLREDEGHRPQGPVVEFPMAARGQRPSGISFGAVAALFILLLAITSIPIVLHPWPPMSDYINHLARMQVIATINSDPDLARFYEIDWQLIPNLMMDLMVPVLVRVMSIYSAGQAYMIASFVLILSGTFALNRRLHGRWS